MAQEKPIPTCQVCSEESKPLIIEGNFNEMKLSDIVNYLKHKLFDVEEFSLNKGSNEIYNSE